MKEFFNDIIKIALGVLIANILAQFVSKFLKGKSDYEEKEEEETFEID